jgi:hypothetical protein
MWQCDRCPGRRQLFASLGESEPPRTPSPCPCPCPTLGASKPAPRPPPTNTHTPSPCPTLGAVDGVLARRLRGQDDLALGGFSHVDLGLALPLRLQNLFGGRAQGGEGLPELAHRGWAALTLKRAEAAAEANAGRGPKRGATRLFTGAPLKCRVHCGYPATPHSGSSMTFLMPPPTPPPKKHRQEVAHPGTPAPVSRPRSPTCARLRRSASACSSMALRTAEGGMMSRISYRSTSSPHTVAAAWMEACRQDGEGTGSAEQSAA